MRNWIVWTVAVVVLSSRFSTLTAMDQKPIYPSTRVDPVTEKLHGVDITDPYRWLENADSPEVRAWVTKQNHLTEELLSKLPGRATIRERLNAFLDIGTISTPHPVKGRCFYTKRSEERRVGKECRL